MKTYKIIRMYFNEQYKARTIKRGLTLEEAKAHCQDPETSSNTCTLPKLVKLTQERGPWFDGFEAE